MTCYNKKNILKKFSIRSEINEWNLPQSNSLLHAVISKICFLVNTHFRWSLKINKTDLYITYALIYQKNLK